MSLPRSSGYCPARTSPGRRRRAGARPCAVDRARAPHLDRPRAGSTRIRTSGRRPRLAALGSLIEVAGLSNTLGLVGDRPRGGSIRRLTLDISNPAHAHGDFMGIIRSRHRAGRRTAAVRAGRRRPPHRLERHRWMGETVRPRDNHRPRAGDVDADRPVRPGWTFGTASCEKRDLVLGAAAGIGLLTPTQQQPRGSHGACATPHSPRSRPDRGVATSWASSTASSPHRGWTAPARPTSARFPVARLHGATPPRPDRRDLRLPVRPAGLAHHALGAAALRHSVLCVQVVNPPRPRAPVSLLHFADPATRRPARGRRRRSRPAGALRRGSRSPACGDRPGDPGGGSRPT